MHRGSCLAPASPLAFVHVADDLAPVAPSVVPSRVLDVVRDYLPWNWVSAQELAATKASPDDGVLGLVRRGRVRHHRGMAALPALPNLRALDVAFTGLYPGDFAGLGDVLDGLTALTAGDPELTAAPCPLLFTAMPVLRSLELRRLQLTGGGIAALRLLGRLVVSNASIDADAFAAVADLPCLRELEFSSHGAPVDWAATVGAMRRLVSLRVSGSGERRVVSVSGLARLTGLSELALVDFYHMTDDEAMPVVAGMHLLTSADLSGSYGLTPNAVRALVAAAPGLRTVRLCRLRHMTDAGLAELRALPALTELAADGCRRVEGDALRELARAGCPLRLLSLSRCGGLGGISAAAAFPRLTSLDVAASGQLVDDGIDAIAALAGASGAATAAVKTSTPVGFRCPPTANLLALRLSDDVGVSNSLPLLPTLAPSLTTLSVDVGPSTIPVGDEAIKGLARLPALRELRLPGTSCTTDGLAPLSRLPALTSLDIGRISQRPSEGAGPLPLLPRLRRLVLRLPRAPVLTDFSALPFVEELTVKMGLHCEFTGAFPPLPRLSSLMLSMGRLSPAIGFGIIAGLRQLTALRLHECVLPDRPHQDAAAGFNLPLLTTLRFDACRIEGDTILDGVTAPALREVFFSGCTLPDAAVAALQPLPELRALHVQVASRFTGSGLHQLAASAPGLAVLEFVACNELTDTALECVAGLRQLRLLSIGYCRRVRGEPLLRLDPDHPASLRLQLDGCPGFLPAAELAVARLAGRQ